MTDEDTNQKRDKSCEPDWMVALERMMGSQTKTLKGARDVHGKRLGDIEAMMKRNTDDNLRQVHSSVRQDDCAEGPDREEHGTHRAAAGEARGAGVGADSGCGLYSPSGRFLPTGARRVGTETSSSAVGGPTRPSLGLSCDSTRTASPILDVDNGGAFCSEGVEAARFDLQSGAWQRRPAWLGTGVPWKQSMSAVSAWRRALRKVAGSHRPGPKHMLDVMAWNINGGRTIAAIKT